jgi:dTDP-4-amino-4,6-dideoxygalactose transaminase
MSNIEANFPVPAIPLSPVFSRLSRSNNTESSSLTTSILDTRYQLHVSSGRAGIALALEHANISAGDEVLIPAFHCESMVAPIHRSGAKPVFFRIHADANIDLADIADKITPRTKVILATHYFGFPQNLVPLQEICATHKLVLIEDCAHTFFGSLNGITVGQWGDYAIASSMKFFPVYDGGMLVSNSRNLDTIKLDTPPLGFQLKALSNILEKAIGYKRLGLIGKLLNLALSAKSLIWRVVKTFAKNDKPGISAGPSSADGGYGLDENWINKSISWPSKKVIERTDREQLVSARRANYLKIHRALQNITGCHPLHSTLPDGVIPLVYPIYIEQPQRHFAKLKNLGVPIWRFGEYLDEEVDSTLCANSVDLSAHIFQFPCHQELNDDEIDWMIKTIKTEFEH